MGDGNSVRDASAWSTFGAIHVRDTTWKTASKAWLRDANLWKLVFTTEQPPSITCAQFGLCQAGGTPACNTLAGCVEDGEQHRIEWTFTGATDGFHAAIHRKIGAGSFISAAEDIPLDQANPDVGCCEIISGACDPPEGQHLFNFLVSTDEGACTTDYTYRVIAELDGSDTQVGSSQDTSTETGCNEACVS